MKKTSGRQGRHRIDLIDRQRRLWSHAEEIELAQSRGEPIRKEVSEWLQRALKNIACGADANEVFDVASGRKGLRKGGFKAEMERKFASSFIAASKELRPDVSVKEAQEEIAKALPALKQATIRRIWNSAKTDRKPTFTLGKK